MSKSKLLSGLRSSETQNVFKSHGPVSRHSLFLLRPALSLFLVLAILDILLLIFFSVIFLKILVWQRSTQAPWWKFVLDDPRGTLLGLAWQTRVVGKTRTATKHLRTATVNVYRCVASVADGWCCSAVFIYSALAVRVHTATCSNGVAAQRKAEWARLPSALHRMDPTAALALWNLPLWFIVSFPPPLDDRAVALWVCRRVDNRGRLDLLLECSHLDFIVCTLYLVFVDLFQFWMF